MSLFPYSYEQCLPSFYLYLSHILIPTQQRDSQRLLGNYVTLSNYFTKHWIDVHTAVRSMLFSHFNSLLEAVFSYITRVRLLYTLACTYIISPKTDIVYIARTLKRPDTDVTDLIRDVICLTISRSFSWLERSRPSTFYFFFFHPSGLVFCRLKDVILISS